MPQIFGRCTARGWRWSLAAFAQWLVLTGLVPVHAQGAPAHDAFLAQEAPAHDRSRLVAQTVFSIIHYTRWPTALATVRLCVLGPTEYADALLKGSHGKDELGKDGLVPGPRKVLARRVFADEPALLAECDALYAGAVPDDEWRTVLARVAGQPLLTLSERKALCVIGSMVCLDVQGHTVAFEINLDSVARSEVRINPRVLQLGRRKTAP